MDSLELYIRRCSGLLLSSGVVLAVVAANDFVSVYMTRRAKRKIPESCRHSGGRLHQRTVLNVAAAAAGSAVKRTPVLHEWHPRKPCTTANGTSADVPATEHCARQETICSKRAHTILSRCPAIGADWLAPTRPVG